MEQTVKVSTLLVQEKETVNQLLVDSYSQYEEVFRSPEAWDNYINQIKTSLDNPNVEQVLVAKHGSTIVGSIQMFESGDKAYNRDELSIEHPVIRLLAVHPEARGLGVAQVLLRESLERAAAKGAKRLYLHTGDIMEKAWALYEWLGFERDATNEFRNGDSVVRCYYYDLHKDWSHIAAKNKGLLDQLKEASPILG
ncbi:GNAT family N-acetyltransferase [Alkalihalobacillus sp. NPDC078783]